MQLKFKDAVPSSTHNELRIGDVCMPSTITVLVQRIYVAKSPTLQGVYAYPNPTLLAA